LPVEFAKFQLNIEEEEEEEKEEEEVMEVEPTGEAEFDHSNIS